MHVVVMMVVVMMMMVHGSRHRSGRRGSGFLGDGIAGEAERENGRGRKGLDHGRTFLSLANPKGSQQPIELAA